jgi:hypothetical protein
MTLKHWQRALVLALLAVLVFPSLTFAVSYTDVVEAFKYTYGVDKMLFLGSIETVMWNLIKRRKKEVGGRGQWLISYQKQNAGVFKGMTEGATLTTRRAQPATAEATFSLVEFEAVWDVTWKMLRQAAKGKDAFETAMTFMDNSIRRRVFRVINSQLCSFTGMGELAILPDADDQTTITVNSLPFADQGMYMDLVDASDNSSLLLTGVTANDIDVEGRTITVSGSAPSGTAAGDFFVPSGQIASGHHYALHGMGAWVSDVNPPAVVGNLGNINRSTVGNRFYQGNVLDNGGTLRAFTEDWLISGENLMRERGGGQPDRYVANSNVLKRYHGDLITDRYVAYNKVQALGAGGEKVGFGREGMDLDPTAESKGETPYLLSGKSFHCEPYFRANRVLGWSDEHFFIGHDGTEVPTPLSEIFENDIPYFTHTGAAKFDVWHYWEAQLLCDNPQAGIQFQDVAES